MIIYNIYNISRFYRIVERERKKCIFHLINNNKSVIQKWENIRKERDLIHSLEIDHLFALANIDSDKKYNIIAIIIIIIKNHQNDHFYSCSNSSIRVFQFSLQIFINTVFLSLTTISCN